MIFTGENFNNKNDSIFYLCTDMNTDEFLKASKLRCTKKIKISKMAIAYFSE